MELVIGQPKPDQIDPNDLKVKLSGAFILHTSFGSLVSLRTELEKIFGRDLVYPTISSQALYVVHWNDLSEEKKRSLGKGRQP